MKILVVAAMPNELKAIKEGIKSADLKMNLDIDYLCCGIGNYETISSLEHYLTESEEPVFVWNIGICGYWNQMDEQRLEPIQVASVINVHTKKEMIVPPFLQLASMKMCFSSENVITEKPDIQADEMYFDMESRGIEFIASKWKYPRLILKIPFDFVGKNKSIENKSYKELAEKVYELLKSLPYHGYLKKIIDWITKQ